MLSSILNSLESSVDSSAVVGVELNSVAFGFVSKLISSSFLIEGTINSAGGSDCVTIIAVDVDGMADNICGSFLT